MSERLRYVERRAGPDDAGRRLDKILRSFLGELPLSAIYRAMRTKRVLVNGAPAQASYRVSEGDVLAMDPRLMPSTPPDHPAEGPSSILGLAPLGDLLILATADLLFLNKPRGMLVHGDESLEERVREALADRSDASLSFSPGPLHRLDRNTSGLVVFPRSSAGARAFSALIRERRIVKLYLALVEGRLEGEELWTDRIERDGALRTSSVGEAGAPARSLVRPLATSEGYSLLRVGLQTGLTHQIRVQAASRAHPLAGDKKYGGQPLPGGYILHALALRFPDPPFPDMPATIIAPLPRSARSRLNALFGTDFMEKILESSIDV